MFSYLPTISQQYIRSNLLLDDKTGDRKYKTDCNAGFELDEKHRQNPDPIGITPELAQFLWHYSDEAMLTTQTLN